MRQQVLAVILFGVLITSCTQSSVESVAVDFLFDDVYSAPYFIGAGLNSSGEIADEEVKVDLMIIGDNDAILAEKSVVVTPESDFKALSLRATWYGPGVEYVARVGLLENRTPAPSPLPSGAVLSSEYFLVLDEGCNVAVPDIRMRSGDDELHLFVSERIVDNQSVISIEDNNILCHASGITTLNLYPGYQPLSIPVVVQPTDPPVSITANSGDTFASLDVNETLTVQVRLNAERYNDFAAALVVLDTNFIGLQSLTGPHKGALLGNSSHGGYQCIVTQDIFLGEVRMMILNHNESEDSYCQLSFNLQSRLGGNEAAWIDAHIKSAATKDAQDIPDTNESSYFLITRPPDLYTRCPPYAYRC